MIVVSHRIAGIIFRTQSDVWLPFLQEEPYEWFRISDTEPDVRQRIHKVGADSLTLSPPAGEERAYLLRYTHGWPGRLSSPIMRSPVVRAALQTWLERPEHVEIQLYQNWVIIRDFTQRELDLFYMPEPAEYPSELYVASHLPAMFSTFLSLFSAILIHGAGVVRNGKAAVFLAPGGGGKTSVTMLSADAPPLSDDQIILRKEGCVVNVHATPLARNTGGPDQARLGGLFLLEKAPHFELVPLEARDMLQCLWEAYSNNTSLPTTSLKKQMFAVLYDTCYQASVYRMRFSKDYVDWDAIDAAMVR